MEAFSRESVLRNRIGVKERKSVLNGQLDSKKKQRSLPKPGIPSLVQHVLYCSCLGFLSGFAVCLCYFFFLQHQYGDKIAPENSLPLTYDNELSPLNVDNLQESTAVSLNEDEHNEILDPLNSHLPKYLYQTRIVKGMSKESPKKTTSEVGCYEICMSIPDCAAFTYSRLDDYCFPYQSTQNITLETGVGWHVSAVLADTINPRRIRRTRDSSWINPQPGRYKRYFIYDGASNEASPRKDYRTVVRSKLEKVGLVKDRSQSKWHIYWGLKWDKVQDFSQLLPSQHISTFPGIEKLICRKDTLHMSAVRAKTIFGKNVIDSFMPWSFLVQPNETTNRLNLVQKIKEFEKDQLKLTWALKAMNSWSGRGVSIFSSDELLRRIESLNQTKVVVQKYIHNPLTLEGYKFDTRWWALITSLSPLRVYMIPNAYVRVGSTKYDPSESYFGDKCMHITSGAVQKKCHKSKRSKNYREPPVDILDERFQRLLSDSYGRKLTHDHQNFRTAALAKKTKTAIMKSILMVLSDLRQFRANTTQAKCFQLLSYDFVYDDVYGVPWMLEVNAYGYLGHGIQKVSPGKDYIAEMFKLVGLNGYDRSEYVERFEKSMQFSGANFDIVTKLSLQDGHDEFQNRGHWDVLFPPADDSMDQYIDFLSSKDLSEARLTAYWREV